MNQTFYKKVIRIGLPITLSQLMTSLLGFVDTVMVSSLGDDAISAVGIGANFYFLMFMINFGLISGLSIFFAQFWGNKDYVSIQKTLVVTVLSGILLTGIFVIFGQFFTDFVVSIYNHVENPIKHELVDYYATSYIKIASLGYIFTSLSFVLIMFYRNMERVIFPQAVTFFTVILNTILNYVLINGYFMFPAMGVKGAAIATVISSVLGFLWLSISFVLSKEEVFQLSLKAVQSIDRSFLKRLFSKALPVMVNETFWGLGMSMYIIAYSFIDDVAFPSYHIANTIIGIFWVINAGISNACAIMLGNKLGENDILTAKIYGDKFVKLAFVSGIVMGVLVLVLSPYIPLMFKDASTEIKFNATLILVVFSLFQPIKFTNAIHIVGTLRSGGDTRFALFAEVGVLWGFGVPMAFILSLFTGLSIYIVVFIVNFEEVIKLFLVHSRYKKYKWARNLSKKET